MRRSVSSTYTPRRRRPRGRSAHVRVSARGARLLRRAPVRRAPGLGRRAEGGGGQSVRGAGCTTGSGEEAAASPCSRTTTTLTPAAPPRRRARRARRAQEKLGVPAEARLRHAPARGADARPAPRRAVQRRRPLVLGAAWAARSLGERPGRARVPSAEAGGGVEGGERRTALEAERGRWRAAALALQVHGERERERRPAAARRGRRGARARGRGGRWRGR